MVAKDRYRGILNDGEVERDEVFGEQVQDRLTVGRWKQWEEWCGIEEICFGSNGDRSGSGASLASVILCSPSKCDGFERQASGGRG